MCAGGKVQGLNLPKRVFPCASPAEVRSTLPEGKDVLAFQCRNPIHKAHYELFIRALEAPNVREGAVCLVHPTCGPTQVNLFYARALISQSVHLAWAQLIQPRGLEGSEWTLGSTKGMGYNELFIWALGVPNVPQSTKLAYATV